MNVHRLEFVGAIAAIAALTLGVPNLAHAGDGTYVVALGAGVSVSPDYEGSNDYTPGAIPLLSLGWESDAEPPKGGTGLDFGLHDITLNIPGSLDVGLAKLYRPEGVYSAQIGVALNGGRKESDNDALTGMGKISVHALATAGVNFESSTSGLNYGIAVHNALSSKDYGYSVNGQLGFAFGLSDSLTLTPSVNTVWANKDHMQSYFGVSSAQAATSTNSAFDAKAGFKSVGLGAELEWTISENWMLNTSAEYSKLTEDAAQSPLVKTQGSPDQFTLSTAVIYKF